MGLELVVRWQWKLMIFVQKLKLKVLLKRFLKHFISTHIVESQYVIQYLMYFIYLNCCDNGCIGQSFL